MCKQEFILAIVDYIGAKCAYEKCITAEVNSEDYTNPCIDERKAMEIGLDILISFADQSNGETDGELSEFADKLRSGCSYSDIME